MQEVSAVESQLENQGARDLAYSNENAENAAREIVATQRRGVTFGEQNGRYFFFSLSAFIIKRRLYHPNVSFLAEGFLRDAVRQQDRPVQVHHAEESTMA